MYGTKVEAPTGAAVLYRYHLLVTLHNAKLKPVPDSQSNSLINDLVYLTNQKQNLLFKFLVNKSLSRFVPRMKKKNRAGLQI